MSRPLLRSILELRPALARTIPTSRPCPATTTTTGAVSLTRRLISSTPRPSAVAEVAQEQPSAAKTTNKPDKNPNPNPNLNPALQARYPPENPIVKPLSDSVRALLPHLAAASRHYMTIHVHSFAFLVTLGDHVRLPFRMDGVIPGDVVRITRASVLGSRDLTLRGNPYVDERLFECRATVLGVEAEPMRLKLKKKRRCRRTKTVRSKHKYTMLSISELRIKGLDEVEGA